MKTTASMNLVLALLLTGCVCTGCYESPQVCQPACAGRVCGPDPRCGLSCGECEAGMTCTSAGQCTPAGGDPGPADGGDAPADGDAGHDAGTDAGQDAGHDAGFDAGTDAGVDAGGDPGGPCDHPDLDCRLPDDQTPISQGPDEDEDGWGVCCDCDDGDPDVHPYLVEIPDDEKDNDCNGLVDEPGGLMVRAAVLGTEYWIDVYEVGVYDNPDCTGTQYGVDADDYPAGFPETVTLYACSLPGVIPSGHLSWNRARRACEAQGKRLCSADEWGAGCAGGENYWYPYGPGFSAGVCNDPVAGARAPVPTGSRSVCLSPTGTYDQSGNLAEWVQDWDPDFPDNALTGGGSYARELCAEGADCYQGDPEDPTDLDKFQDTLDCLLSAQRMESFIRSDPRPYLGTRCCYKEE